MAPPTYSYIHTRSSNRQLTGSTILDLLLYYSPLKHFLKVIKTIITDPILSFRHIVAFMQIVDAMFCELTPTKCAMVMIPFRRGCNIRFFDYGLFIKKVELVC